MSRPLLITDCDEVLLHMVAPFRAWLDEAHDIDFVISGAHMGDCLTRRACGTRLVAAEVWPLLDGFFTTEMHRQPAAPGAAEALARIATIADIVILTNLRDEHRDRRAAQIAALGMPYRVATNQGPKGPALARLVEEIQPSRTVFVDDLPPHHSSVAETLPEVARLHMIVEPLLQSVIPAAPDADARIDDWDSALPWIWERLTGEQP